MSSQYKRYYEGIVNETSNFSGDGLNAGDVLTLDFKGAKYINSVAVKNLSELIGQNSQVNFELIHLPVPLVQSLSVASGMITKNVKIRSIEIPYFCEICNTTVPELYKDPQDYQFGVSWPNVEVTKTHICNNKMSLAMDPNRYFKLLPKKL